MIPMGKPLLPPAEMLLPYLKRIDGSRWYSNGGPLVREYEDRLGALMGCAVAATSSGMTAMTAALIALDVGGELSMPSWTFVATANAAKAAGCWPEFVDVEETTWAPLSARITVAPFGAPAKDGEVLIDAAAAFDAYATGMSKVGSVPVVISTHSTKTFSTSEGGIVLSRDKDFICDVHAVINHGLTDAREAPRIGLNGKMSEYHAALGLAELDHWAWKRNKWLDLKRRYVQAFGSLAHTTPLSSLSWVGSTFCVRLVGKDGEVIREALQAQGIASRAVWGRGVHRYETYRHCDSTPLPVTETLAREVVFVPYSIDQTDAEIEGIVKAVQACV